MTDWLRRIALALTAIVVALGFATPAGADGEITVEIGAVDDSEFPVVRLIVTADELGRPLGDLTAENLEVTESGAPAEIVSVERAVDAATPLGLVVVIDASGSMEGVPLAAAKISASSLVSSLGAQDQAAIVAFGDTVEVVQPMTSDQAALFAAIDGLVAVGNTRLYDAVGEASALAASSGFERRAVVLLSDGREFGDLSTRSRDESLGAVPESGALFYPIGLGPDIDLPYLEEIATLSGGRVYPAPTTEEMASVFATIEDRLRSQFVVSIESSADPAAQDRSVVVNVRSGESTGSAERAYESRREPVPEPTAAPTVAAVVTPAATVVPPPVEEEGGNGVLIVAGALALLLALAGLGAALVRRRRSRPRIVAPPTVPDVRPLPAREVNATEVPPGRLMVFGGPAGDTEIELGDAPVTVGSGPTCTLRLPAAPGIAPEHARFWRRDGHPMLHHLDRGSVTHVNGQQVGWASIAESDEITIGPYVLRYASGGMPVTADRERGAVGDGA